MDRTCGTIPRRHGPRPGLRRIAVALVALASAAAAGAPARGQESDAHLSPAAGAAPASALDGAGLVSDAPVYLPVRPPSRYEAAVERGTRSPDGRPGPAWWQPRTDYRIRAALDPETARVTGSAAITWHNGSPDEVGSLVLHLYQNVFAEGVARNRAVTLTGGMDIARIALAGTALDTLPAPRFEDGRFVRPEGAGYRIDGTLATVQFADPVAPGDSVTLEVDWGFTVSGGGGFRAGHLDHEVFNVAQWYPQVAVYDDIWGWDRSPYLGNGEFYVGYGRFEVELDLPAGWVAVGTGDLANPEEVLRPEQAAALAGAPALDTVVAVVSAADREAGRATRTGGDGRLTWRFVADSVRDFAWAASNRYVWHVTGAETGGPRGRVLIQNVFDPDVEAWADATLYAKHAIEFFSDYILPYPYPQATAAMGPPQVNGMEYPMLTFITWQASGRGLAGVVIHELSHFWMPMIVGTKEMAYAWMDEGLTTFNTALAMDDLFDTSQGRFGSMNGYLQAARMEMEVPIMQHTDYAENPFGRSVAAYSKPGSLMHTLRHVMGEERFDAVYREYARTWAFRHPTPWDFFRMFEEAAGTDLDWFWQPWFYETATLDQALASVRPVAGGVEVTVENRRDGVMPVEIHLEGADGSRAVHVWPASVWAGTRTATRTLPFDGDVGAVHVDPEHYYPDIDRRNNEWKAKP
ncbi:MAG: M1 family metallopeptidase [Gemmatimonadota bacterium]|nr:M1 family metallopeptidase [Gemmatimonadota bacterium]